MPLIMILSLIVSANKQLGNCLKCVILIKSVDGDSTPISNRLATDLNQFGKKLHFSPKIEWKYKKALCHEPSMTIRNMFSTFGSDSLVHQTIQIGVYFGRS